MEWYVCIDDTDSIDSRGTGELAEIIARFIEEEQWGKVGKVTRHQLLVHKDIPYTSHNSAMCFPIYEVNREAKDLIIPFIENFLKNESAPGSDPGLCVADKMQLIKEPSLIKFGNKAKIQVLTKEEAYSLAKLCNVHLSEHGGTGQGIIGAIAGVGLRLSGNDGRFKGKYILPEYTTYRVSDIIAKTGIDRIQTKDGQVVPNDGLVKVDQPIKTVLLESMETLLVQEAELDTWKIVGKQDLRSY
ncbi:hypothetical protein [Desulfuribacillus alkaliarsenatis]|uniref:Uncharacterized protein n=1 Tax=Desulfuribacillus alkaliarsenatis TaxID=766136 RepID=A0A1E5FZ98_9FIRM|nr:hypothetical protein [Desulfuribacillus alkaliarsenatis]OEF95906.1 hypothetical protein BHF68_10975 [Desulfuribacillus alkaliarsenatis]